MHLKHAMIRNTVPKKADVSLSVEVEKHVESELSGPGRAKTTQWRCRFFLSSFAISMPRDCVRSSRQGTKKNHGKTRGKAAEKAYSSKETQAAACATILAISKQFGICMTISNCPASKLFDFGAVRNLMEFA